MQQFAVRIRRQFGTYSAEEWSLFLHDHGMWWAEEEIMPVRAVVAGNLVLIRGGLTPFERAFVVWHEVGHAMLHPGDAEWWLTRPQGRITVAKIERQANDFAWLFPIWERGFIDEAIHHYGIDFSPRIHSMRW